MNPTLREPPPPNPKQQPPPQLLPPPRSPSSFPSAASSAARGVGTRPSCLLFLGFCFSGGIDEVVATMACWNKVSPVSPYLDDVQSGAGEGPVRVCVPRSVGSLQILAVCVSFKEYFWLAFGVATTTSSSVLFCGLSRFLQPSELVVMECKSVYMG